MFLDNFIHKLLKFTIGVTSYKNVVYVMQLLDGFVFDWGIRVLLLEFEHKYIHIGRSAYESHSATLYL